MIFIKIKIENINILLFLYILTNNIIHFKYNFEYNRLEMESSPCRQLTSCILFGLFIIIFLSVFFSSAYPEINNYNKATCIVKNITKSDLYDCNCKKSCQDTECNPSTDNPCSSIKNQQGQCCDGYHCAHETCQTCHRTYTRCSRRSLLALENYDDTNLNNTNLNITERKKTQTCRTHTSSYKCNCKCDKVINNRLCTMNCHKCYSFNVYWKYYDNDGSEHEIIKVTEVQSDKTPPNTYINQNTRCYYNKKNNNDIKFRRNTPWKWAISFTSLIIAILCLPWILYEFGIHEKFSKCFQSQPIESNNQNVLSCPVQYNQNSVFPSLAYNPVYPSSAQNSVLPPLAPKPVYPSSAQNSILPPLAYNPVYNYRRNHNV